MDGPREGGRESVTCLGHDALALISSGCARLVGQLAHHILSFHHCQMLDRLNCTSNRTGLKNQQNRPVPVLENRPVLIRSAPNFCAWPNSESIRKPLNAKRIRVIDFLKVVKQKFT
jgi:hypothetical protein